MRNSPGGLTVALLLVSAVAATPAVAQDYDGAAGYGIGAIWFSDFNAGGTGAPLRLDPGWVAHAHVEQWYGTGRVGARASGAFTRRPLPMVDHTRQIETWFLGADLLGRFAAPHPARQVAPFLALGAGLARYGLGEGPPIVFVPESARYPGAAPRRLTLNLGLGVDLMPDWTLFDTPIGVRAEVMDQVALRSPFAPLEGGRFDPLHNVRLSLGVLGFFDHLFR
jgi:hypothetical protein